MAIVTRELFLLFLVALEIEVEILSFIGVCEWIVSDSCYTIRLL